MLAFDVQGGRLDGHSDRAQLLLHGLREEVQNGASLRAAGAAGAAPRLPPQRLAIARVQRLRVYMQKTQHLLVVCVRVVFARHQDRPSGVLRVLRKAENYLARGREQSGDHLAQSRCEGCVMVQGLQDARQLPCRPLAHVPPRQSYQQRAAGLRFSIIAGAAAVLLASDGCREAGQAEAQTRERQLETRVFVL